jgi:hypothetical protein
METVRGQVEECNGRYAVVSSDKLHSDIKQFTSHLISTLLTWCSVCAVLGSS